MKRLLFLILPILVFLNSGCDNNSAGGITDPFGPGPGTGTDLSLANLAGTWNATKYEWVNQANSSESIDAIQHGLTLSLVVQQGGQVTLSFQGPGGQGSESGTMTISGNQITINWNGGGEEVYTANLSGNTLTLTGTDSFDFNGDGAAQAATLNIDFQRQ